jgi:hypothetical protein
LQNKLQVNRRLLQLNRRPFGPLNWSTINMQISLFLERSNSDPSGKSISMCVATRSFIEAASSLTRESVVLPKDRVAVVALPLKTVYDLAAKTRFSLRFNCKNLPRKSFSLRFTCNRQRVHALIRERPGSGQDCPRRLRRGDALNTMSIQQSGLAIASCSSS